MMDDSDCLMECPYNKSHRVHKSRIQTHLFKCRKNYPSVELRRCPFNANHDIVPAEYHIHLETCPDRGSVQNHLAQSVEERKPVIMPYKAPVLPSEGENWDCDEPVPTYDPTTKNINVKVLRSLQGASKSERKNHRARERLRFNAVAENGGLEGAVGGSYDDNANSAEVPSHSKQAFACSEEVRNPKTKPATFATLPPSAGNPQKSLATAPKSPLRTVEAPSFGLPLQNMPAENLPENKPAAVLAWGNGLVNGLQAAGIDKSGGPEMFQGPWQAAPAQANFPHPSNGYQVSVSVLTGDGVPAPNLERHFPALGRGRGRLHNNKTN